MPTSRRRVDHLSLAEIEGELPAPPPDSSGLVQSVHRLWRIPIVQLAPTDLRLLLGQRLGARWLIPRTLEMLRDDPWMEAKNYPGDLLLALLDQGSTFWASEPQWYREALELLERAESRPSDDPTDEVREQFSREASAFRSRAP